MKQHERIWLQTEHEATGEMTWCEDKINDDDVEYVRGDLFAQLEAELETYSQPATCNKGHTTLPIKLWDCPSCTAELKAENEALRDKIHELYATYDVDAGVEDA